MMSDWDELHYKIDDGYGIKNPQPDDIIVVHQCGERLKRGTTIICSGYCRGNGLDFRLTNQDFLRRIGR
jgi:hypothetical protein